MSGKTSEQINVLSDREHVRLRTNVYLGTMEPTSFNVPIFGDDKFEIKQYTFVPAAYKAVGEILDNCLDEFTKCGKSNKVLTIRAQPQQGCYTIIDNGRGIPIGKHHQLKDKYTPEVALGMLRSGRNFNEANNEVGVQGMNGVGSSCVNFCSTSFHVNITHGHKNYDQNFTFGAEKVSKPHITAASSTKTGTAIEFVLDPQVFKDVKISEEVMRNRAKEIAFNCPDVTVEYNNEKFRYKKGFDEVIKRLSKDYFVFEQGDIQFYVVFDLYEDIDEAVFTWVNNSFMFDGGICNTQFINGFTDKVLEKLESAAKRKKCQVLKADVVRNLLVFGFIKVANPKYDSQAKTRLTGPTLRKEIDQMIDDHWDQFAKKNKKWVDAVFDRAFFRHHHREDKKATEEHEKKRNQKIEGLLDANPPDKDRSKCILYVMEGDSAKSSIVEVRDPHSVASYPLGGKINNTYGCTIAQVLKMGKLTDLLAAIGLTPGRKALRHELRYGKLVIATDADYDGSDIFSLLICLFFKFWPELFDPLKPPFVFRLLAPNVVVSKGEKRIHFADRTQFEQAKEKYKGWSVEYMKGLGSMQLNDWEQIVNGVTDVLIPIQDIDDKMEETLELLFGPDPDCRKTWLMSKESI